MPKDLQGRLKKTRLKRSLRTGDIRQAVRLKRAVLAEFDCLVDAERCAISAEASQRKKGLLLPAAVQKGMAFRTQLANPDFSAEDLAAVHLDIAIAHKALLGERIDQLFDEDDIPIDVYRPENERDAKRLLEAAYPNAFELRLDKCHRDYIEDLKLTLRGRTIADDERAYKYFKQWCADTKTSLDLTQFTSLMARNFLRSFETYAGKISEVTKSKYLYRLKKFWGELKIQGLVVENVWIDHVGKLTAKPDDERERAFTMEEVRRLLMGGAPPKLHDLIIIGLLTGARLEAIVCLKVCNVGEDYIIFNRQKRETGDRAVPMHPLLRPIFARRTADRGPNDDLFPEWPAPKRAGSLRERSFKASNAFTAYRQKPNVNVHDQLPGARRSRVNFHSCRRWFITHFRRSASLHLTRAVVGHSQVSMTDRIYAGGPLFEAAKSRLQQIELPLLTDMPVKEPRGINLYEYLKLSIDDSSEEADEKY